MTISADGVDLASLPRPEVGRRPRRRRGWVVALLAAGAFAIVGLCVWGLLYEISRPESEVREGLASLAYMVVGGMALVVALGLAAWAISTLTSPDVVHGEAWLVDPLDAAQVRWWDGRAWSAFTATRDPAVAALPPLRSSSRRRHAWGWALLIGGVATTIACQWASSRLVAPATAAFRPDGQVEIVSQSSALLPLAMNLGVIAPLVAVVGLYFALTLSPDPRPGWVADPLDPEQVRWWDGLAWSDLAADSAPPASDGPAAAPDGPA